MDIGNFIIYTETENIYLDMLKHNLILHIIQWEDFYLKEKIKKVIELKKDGLGGKAMTEFAVLRPKSYSYLTNDKNMKLEKQNMHHKKRT